MKIEHLALYVRDLEGAKAFFETYFEARSNSLYHNPKTGFSSYFLSFADGARLEIMTKAPRTVCAVRQQSKAQCTGQSESKEIKTNDIPCSPLRLQRLVRGPGSGGDQVLR